MNALPEDSLDVLYVGDDPDLAEIYRMKLELDGYLVRSVTREDEWPPGSWQPDIAYFDVQEGKGIGVRGHHRLRQSPDGPAIPAIVLSRLPVDQLAEQGMRLGPLDYLVIVSTTLASMRTVDVRSGRVEDAVPHLR
ncbi:MAG TPA: hypothetical protein VET65_12740 [Candidatus Limnocylindrales bacterium]|nr:hypothetical protein [Candidatus Limnocylindrales bacterium]